MSFQRRPFLTPIWLTAFAAIFGLACAIFALWIWGTADTTTVIVIADPPSTPTGEARATLLANMFGDGQAPGHLDAIYVAPALRDRPVTQALAARLRVTPIVVPSDNSVSGNSKALARRVLREHGGGRILIIGRSDSVPSIVEALAEEKGIPAISDEGYGRMYMVTVPRIGHGNFVGLNY